MAEGEKKLFNQEGVVLTTDRLFVGDHHVYNLDDIVGVGVYKDNDYQGTLIGVVIAIAVLIFWHSIWAWVVAVVCMGLSYVNWPRDTKLSVHHQDGEIDRHEYSRKNRGVLGNAEALINRTLKERHEKLKKHLGHLVREEPDRIPEA